MDIATEYMASNEEYVNERPKRSKGRVILYRSNLPINILSFELIYSVLAGTVDCLEKNRDVELPNAM